MMNMNSTAVFILIGTSSVMELIGGTRLLAFYRKDGKILVSQKWPDWLTVLIEISSRISKPHAFKD